ncbi:hypothetical protein GCM10027320_05980 [Massilia solisilvae]
MINLFRAIWFRHVVPLYGSIIDPKGVIFQIDHKLGLFALNGIDISGNWPDFYINLNDRRGPILGEVGEMPSTRWGHVICEDGLPIRILRIGFDFSIGMINPRFTRREVRILKIAQEHLITERLRVYGA